MRVLGNPKIAADFTVVLMFPLIGDPGARRNDAALDNGLDATGWDDVRIKSGGPRSIASDFLGTRS